MLTLGLAGGLDPVHEQVLNSPDNYAYDGAAVLVEDGVVIAAAEESRLNRIRHSDKFPFEGIRFCLEERGVAPGAVDGIGYYVEEAAADALLARFRVAWADVAPRVDARTLLARTVGAALGTAVDPARLYFAQHRLAHAASALGQAAFDACLVYVVDSAGGVFLGRRDAGGGLDLCEVLAIPSRDSLNTLSQTLLPLMGFGLFDDHKAMALAAHGDADRYEPQLASLYELLPDGRYVLHLERVPALAAEIPSRQASEPAEAHKDLAAGMQRTMERIALHVLAHQRRVTGEARLCLAGGMIENSALSGRILSSNLFDRVFVDPAAYDGGCAIGAALLAANARGGRAWAPLHDVYWGTALGDAENVEAELERWHGFLTFDRSDDVVRDVAAALADGAVVGWVQGRAEFGSHALGNRTVVSDPRRGDTVERVGVALGRREPYRPLAAAVLEEEAAELFELAPPTDAFAFLTFSVPVRPGIGLPATTQVDGTARVHTVSCDVNPRFWHLIASFRDITQVPVLATTSFNSVAEPTVDSARDAIASFLTTGLDRLVLGDFVAAKVAPRLASWLDLRISLPPYVRLVRANAESARSADELRTTYEPRVQGALSRPLADALGRLDGEVSVGELLGVGPDDAEPEVLPEIVELWTARLIVLQAPVPEGRAR